MSRPKRTTATWKWYTPDGKVSAAPPDSRDSAERKPTPLAAETTEAVEDKAVTPSHEVEADEDIQHSPPPPADCAKVNQEADAAHEDNDVNPDEAKAWGELTDFIAEAGYCVGGGTVLNPVLNAPEPTPDKSDRRNYNKLTASVEDRFLMCLSMGLSIRAAARAVGCHNSTFVKRAKRDQEFRKAMQRAKEQARTDPLRELYAAARTSWRAAAWLLEYLDRREGLRKEK